MNKKMLLVWAVLILALLSACGNSNDNHASGHGNQSGQTPAANNTTEDSHGGHGGAQKEVSDNLKATFAFASGSAKANQETELTIQITDEDGKPVSEFDINHEKLLHLIVVNHDLSFFNHIHPEFQGDGKFTVNTSFPAGGEYKLFADFIPTGGSNITLSEWVNVEGQEGEHTAITPDEKLVKEVEGKEAELALSGTKPEEEVTLTFNIRDAKTKEGIDSLEPYLGAVGHVVILSADAEHYLHVHPLDEKATGPAAEFATSFPQSGTYKIWGQFQHEGKVFTVPFVVAVK
ncbi:hypothetical protein [Paenibacillus prosopidis]|uniref:Secreted protein n=1 Tax=Paenibacillus prosopidis TaxID=630520 RepID=A0A368W1W1_9BACL|nr:hypothetical protein [Paenibacillus prosopidis]RCW48459.1 hypothetical protein DFP97_106159 [Paenibacillus prosopidis]